MFDGVICLQQILLKKGYQTAPLPYLVSAVEYFVRTFRRYHVHFIVCSDDTKWCRDQDVFRNSHNRPKSYAVSFSEGFSEGFDLALLSQLQSHNHDSGYVWLVGWLAGRRTGGGTTSNLSNQGLCWLGISMQLTFIPLTG